MTAPSRLTAEPVAAFRAAGAPAAEALREAVGFAREWAGGGFVALLLSGSHATGEAVWFEHAGRRFSLSDVDLYAVMRDAGACRTAAERARRGRAAAARRLAEAGIEAPLEVGFLTADGLSRMAARPGTIELVRHGVVVAGDPAVLARVPRFSPGEVPAEEAALLLENRGFELLDAWPRLLSPDARARLQARHATLKAVADLASVLALRAGELPDGSAARIEWARPRAAETLGGALPADLADVPMGLDRLWEASLAWRGGDGEVPAPDEAAGEWRRAVRAWCAVWWWCFSDRRREPWERALRVAARAPLPRRLRRGLFAPGPGSPARRVRLALAGTPQHRVNASGAILLLAAAASAGPPALSAGALRALLALGVTASAAWDDARRDVLAAWDAVVLGGQRWGGPR
jgi:hypothetical protein